ncbi:MAG TPA: hypothetical protein PLY40_07130 [Bacillota bacterium]|nr:hypothetical protein [Bacillota bacterium]
MKKMVDCPNWKEYQGLNGWLMFCSAGAFARKLTRQEAESCGCTAEQRAACLKIMQSSMGYGLVPEVVDEKEAALPATDQLPASTC